VEADELRTEVNRLQQLLKEVSAKEFAMDSATKQNAEILKLLKQAEANGEAVRCAASVAPVVYRCRCDSHHLTSCARGRDSQLQEALSRAKEEIAELHSRHSVRLREAGESEARAIRYERDARLVREELNSLKDSMDSQISEVTRQLEETTRTAAVQLETMAEELRLRREKQYEMLEKIQALEATVDEQAKRIEEADPQVRALQQRNLDLENQLASANRWREAAAASSSETKVLLEAEIVRLKAELAAVKEESAVVKGQMAQMSASVIKLAEKERLVMEQVDKAKQTTRAREGELAVMRERVAQLADDGTCSSAACPLRTSTARVLLLLLLLLVVVVVVVVVVVMMMMMMMMMMIAWSVLAQRCVRRGTATTRSSG
jgi:hypothetical protein